MLYLVVAQVIKCPSPRVFGHLLNKFSGVPLPQPRERAGVSLLPPTWRFAGLGKTLQTVGDQEPDPKKVCSRDVGQGDLCLLHVLAI